jgi:acyl-CoA thioesterase-2
VSRRRIDDVTDATRLPEMLKLLDLERIEDNLFRGESRDVGAPQVFGGQVLGQALVAASRTVEGRQVHSLHAYFLRRGDLACRSCSKSTAAAMAAASQAGAWSRSSTGSPILTMSASFQIVEPGSITRRRCRQPRRPRSCATSARSSRNCLRRRRTRSRVISATSALRVPRREPDGLRHAREAPGQQARLVPCRRAAADDQSLHRCLLTYVSDYHLLATATMPHGVSFFDLQLASIDHAIWFHRDLRVDEWLLYAIDSPSASGARGFSRGSIFTRDGRLVASVAQEGLIREHSSWTRPAGQQT